MTVLHFPFYAEYKFMLVFITIPVPVQSLSRVWLFAARQASLSITNSWSLLKLMSIESVFITVIECNKKMEICYQYFRLIYVFTFFASIVFSCLEFGTCTSSKMKMMYLVQVYSPQSWGQCICTQCFSSSFVEI